jgi:hypothetical protein
MMWFKTNTGEWCETFEALLAALPEGVEVELSRAGSRRVKCQVRNVDRQTGNYRTPRGDACAETAFEALALASQYAELGEVRVGGVPLFAPSEAGEGER